MQLCAPAIGAIALLIPPSTLAADPSPELHFEAAARLGVAFPTYTGASNFNPILDLTAFPVWLDAGLRIGPQFFVGAYFSFAPTSATDAYTSRVSPCDVHCYSRVYRFGLEIQIHPVSLPLGRSLRLDPWIGLGAGYEVQQRRYDSDRPCDANFGYCAQPAHVGALQGPEWFNSQIGVAIIIGAVGVGPYFAASFGNYSTDAGQPLPKGIPHWWLNVGLRVTVTP
jgi:hypothetical protein